MGQGVSTLNAPCGSKAKRSELENNNVVVGSRMKGYEADVASEAKRMAELQAELKSKDDEIK